MRFTVHAEQLRCPVEFQAATAIEAVSKAWQLLEAGAAGLYIYDDEKDQAFWPERFGDLALDGLQPPDGQGCLGARRITLDAVDRLPRQPGFLRDPRDAHGLLGQQGTRALVLLPRLGFLPRYARSPCCLACSMPALWAALVASACA
jgi:hypothetical protein